MPLYISFLQNERFKMLSILNSDPLNQTKNICYITYPRTIALIYGNYAYPEIINNFIIKIKSNLDPKMEGYTNVKGGMTKFDYFLDDPDFINFTTHLINKYQVEYPTLFKNFPQRKIFSDAWGNEIKPGGSVNYHIHHTVQGILFLTEGTDLELPELNLKISPKPGDYYIFPAQVMHGFDKHVGEQNRYSLIFNIKDYNSFQYANLMYDK